MKCINISKAYDGKTVLKDFSASFPEGETTLVMGRSGSGKTTLLRILTGLEKEYEGKVEGLPSSPVVLFQEDRLIPTLSVEGNLRAVSGDGERIEATLVSLGLKGEGKKKVKELSGGMKRRTAIARMLLLEGDFYALDEPFTGLDDETRREVAGVLRESLSGKSVLVVTHSGEDGVLLGATGKVMIGGNDGE